MVRYIVSIRHFLTLYSERVRRLRHLGEELLELPQGQGALAVGVHAVEDLGKARRASQDDPF